MAHDYELEQVEQGLLEKEEQYIEECVNRGEDETAVRQRLVLLQSDWSRTLLR